MHLLCLASDGLPQYHGRMIISASRRCDIPAFYPRWLAKRFERQFVLVRNPFNRHQVGRVGLSPSEVDAIVFWSKNPAPLLPCLGTFEPFPYYFQYTLNGYSSAYEPKLPPIDERIATFLKLSGRCGMDRMVWRYDPILLSPDCTLEWHRKTFSSLCRRLSGYTDTCVISFLDLYRHMQPVCERLGIRTLENAEMSELVEFCVSIATSCGMQIQTCAETIDLVALGVVKGACIDGLRLEKISGKTFLTRKDKYQRSGCNCIESVDIGTYDICSHGCIYCYANPGRSREGLLPMHDDDSPFLIGDPEAEDCVYERKPHSMVVSDTQCLFDFE